jgi:hypothetical protein
VGPLTSAVNTIPVCQLQPLYSEPKTARLVVVVTAFITGQRGGAQVEVEVWLWTLEGLGVNHYIIGLAHTTVRVRGIDC